MAMSSGSRVEAGSPRLVMSGIGKAFGGVPVLSEVNLTAARGEVIGLLGSNGAGKSTLIKILSGVYRADAGRIEIDGEAVAISGPRDAIAHGVGLLPQELSVHPDLTVAENIFIGHLPMTSRLGLPVVDRPRMRAEAGAQLDQLGFGHIAVDRLMKTLAVPEKRIVEIARAIAARAKILIMDEPTAALTETEAASLFAVLRRLKAQGVTVIYISHYLDEVFEICDRIVVLRDGRNAGEFDTAEATHDEVLAAMLGGSVDRLYPDHGRGGGEPLLRVEGLSLPPHLEDVSFEVAAGEIFGVFGLIGSGVGHLGRSLYGAEGEPRDGRITLFGRSYRPSSPQAGKEAGIGFVAAERKAEGIIAELTVRENVTLPFLDRYLGGLALSQGRERERTQHWIEAFGIRTRGPEQRIRFLSGGNQQKVCIVRWLDEAVRLLILEEPTRGVDVGARKEIYAKLRELADGGLGILILSSDMEEVAGLADRSLVLDRGRVAGGFDRPTTASALMRLASGAAETAA